MQARGHELDPRSPRKGTGSGGMCLSPSTREVGTDGQTPEAC